MIIATVTGNVGKDAETRDVNTKNGSKTIVKFSVASNDGKGDDKQTTWVGVTLWRSPGIAPYLKKGTKVICVGPLKTEVGKDGKTYVVMDADHVDFGGGKGGQASNDSAPDPFGASGGGSGDDLPF